MASNTRTFDFDSLLALFGEEAPAVKVHVEATVTEHDAICRTRTSPGEGRSTEVILLSVKTCDKQIPTAIELDLSDEKMEHHWQELEQEAANEFGAWLDNVCPAEYEPDHR